MRKERFPKQRKSKLQSRGDGPFQVLERINDNVYKIDLPGEYAVSASFNVADLSPFDVGDDSRTNRFEEREDDMSSPMKIGAESMELPLGPITRARAKKFQDAVASYIARLWSDGLIAHKTPSSTSLIRNFLQADFSLCQLNLAQFGT